MRISRAGIGPLIVASLALTAPTTAVAAPTTDTIMPTFYDNTPCYQVQSQNQGRPCLSDNSSVTFWFESQVSAKSRDSVERAMNGLNTRTDLSTAYDSTPVDSGSGETDVMYRQIPGDFPAGTDTIGQMWCDDAVNDQLFLCDQAYVNFKISAVWALACHETGHTIGLVHGQFHDPRISGTAETRNKSSLAGCMTTPLDQDRPDFGTTNVANINYIY